MVSIAQRRLDFLARVYRLQGQEELSRTLVEELPELVCGDNVMIGRHDGLSRKLTGLVLRQPFSTQHFLPEANETGLIGCHPFWDHLLDEERPVKVLSRMCSSRRWRENAFHRELLKADGVCDHINIEFGTDVSDFTSIGVLRSRSGFSAEEIETMRLLRPHVALAFSNARQFDRHRMDRAALQPGKMLELDCRGRCCGADLYGLLAQWAGRRIDSVWAGFVRWLSAAIDAYNRGALRIADEQWCLPCVHNRVRFVVRREMLSTRYWLFYWMENRLQPDHHVSLTPQERRVLQLVAEGKTNLEIAGLLGISAQTVKTHLKHLYSKLGVDNRTAAARYVTESGSFATTDCSDGFSN